MRETGSPSSPDSICQVNSIFQQPWWLHAVAPNHWDEVVVRNADGIDARLPFVVKKRLGLTLLTMPQLTQTLGPWLASSEAKYTNRLSQQLQLCETLIKGLPRYDFFLQSFSPAITNWLPFYWAGFSASAHYTYRIDDLTSIDRVWSELRENIRREIRKAEKTVHVRTDLDIDAFLEVQKGTFQRQGMQIPYDLEVARRLDIACSQHDAKRIFFAEDARGKIHAAVYIVWDADAAYYLMGGNDPELRTSGAASLLLWEAIKFSAGVTRRFDFEGSMIAPIERFFRAFGARQVPYFRVSRASRRMRLLAGASQVLDAIVGRKSRSVFDG
jgi:hypothetical protein